MPDVKVKIGGDSSEAEDAFHGAREKLAEFREELNKAADKMFSWEEVSRKATDAIIEFAKESVHALVEFGKSSVEAYEESAKAFRQLKRATGESAEALKEQAEAIQSQLGVSDDLVMKVQAMLGTFGEAPDKIDATTRAILDYSARSGVDAVSATHMLLSSAQTGRTAFKELGLEYNKTGLATQDLTNITDALSKKLGGTAAAEADTLEGSMRKAHEQTEELKKSIGSLLAELIEKTQAVSTFTGLINDLQEVLTGDKQRKATEHTLALNKARENLKFATESVVEEEEQLHKMQIDGAPAAAVAQQIAFVEKLKSSVQGADKAYRDLFYGVQQGLSSKGTDRETGKPKGLGADAKSEEEKEREKNFTAMEEWDRKDLELQLTSENNKKESEQKYFDEVQKIQADENKKAEALSAKREEEQVKRVEEQEKKETEALKHHLEQLRKTAEAENKKFADTMASMGAQIGNAFTTAIKSAIEDAMNGGEVDVLGAAADLAFAVGAIVGQTLATIYGNPAIGQAVGTGIAAAGSLVHSARSQAWKQEQAYKHGQKHDGGWIGPERAHDGRWMGGLSSDEELIVAQRGERMFSRQEVARMGGPAAVDRAARGGSGGGLHVTIVAQDSTSVREFFEDRGGRGIFNALRTGRGSLAPLFGH